MSDFNVLCAGGCGNVQGWTDKQASVPRHRLYCPECAKKVPRPMLRNVDPTQKKLKDLADKIKADGALKPETFQELLNIVSEVNRKAT